MKKIIFLAASIIFIGTITLILLNTAADKDHSYTSVNKKGNLNKIKNVIVIIACSLRADHLSCYGYGKKTSPNIDQLAQKGILFKNCFSQAPYTVHSVASIMTARYPRKVFPMKWNINLPNQAKTFAEIFKEAGFRTLGFMANPWLSKVFNFDQGFDYYFDTSDLIIRFDTEDKRLANRVWGEDLTRGIIGKLKETKGRFFLQSLYIDVHSPYKSSYDGAIRNLDSHIGELVRALKELNLLDSTLIIITADHGEAFGKYHKHDVSHSLFLYNTVIKTPLIFYNPNLPQKGITIENYVTSMDVLPTTLDLLGIQYDKKGFDGISQRAVFNDSISHKKSERPIISETNFLNKKGGMIRSCIIWDQRWKLIVNNKIDYELYDLKNDVNETNNLFAQKMDLAKKISFLFRDWKKNNTQNLQTDMTNDGYTIEKIPPKILRQMKSLGYIQ